MSRIGNAKINIPAAVNVNISDNKTEITGPMGKLSLITPQNIKVEMKDQQIVVSRSNEEKAVKSLHGLTRALLANMVVGVEKGWQKKLELIGVGFRAQTDGSELALNVGFSHPVKVKAPEGIKFAVEENTKITVSGIDKALVGQTAASIRKIKPPEPYQGKGIRYVGEYVKRKAGKAGKVGVGGAKA